eukprot:sb/3475868/
MILQHTFLLLSFLSLGLSDDLYSCGSLMGDGRYCLDYSGQQLKEPPSGTNLTAILDLSSNSISLITKEMLVDHQLLIRLNLSHNEITVLDGAALWQLVSLKEVNDLISDHGSRAPYLKEMRI